MSELSITHTAADGTLLRGTSKGDGAWEAIKAAQATHTLRGWKYFPSIRAIGIRHSRDHAPDLYLIDKAAEVLRAAGFTVDIQVDTTPRPMDEAEADRADRMDARADALTAKADRKNAEADARQAAASRIAERFAGGQPILMGHHSTRRALRDRDRIDSNMRAAVRLGDEADAAQHSAATAERHMQARENPRRVYRRIRTQEAELRKVERSLAPCRYSGRRMKPHMADTTWTCIGCHTEQRIGAGLLIPTHGSPTGRHLEQLRAMQAQLGESLRYWRAALDAARAAGADVPPDPDAIKKGWWVKSWCGWCEVTRVNKVSVTVIDTSWNNGDGSDRSFKRTVTLDDIVAIRETAPGTPTPAVELDETATR